MLTQINIAHRLIGRMLSVTLKAAWTVVACGLFFTLITFWTQEIISQPLTLFKMEGTLVNMQDYAEINQTVSNSSATAIDPDWDGALAGFSLGCAYTSSIPIVGPVLSPLLGAIVGYQLDSSV